MVEKFYIYNKSLDELITFDRSSADYLIDDNGIDWGDISSALSTINNLDGYGATLNAVVTGEPRVVKITGWVVGTEAQMKTKKSKLSRMLSPQDDLIIFIPISEGSAYHYDLTTKLYQSIQFDQAYKNNNEKMCKFTFSLAAAYPFFEYEKSYNITTTTYQVLNMGSIPVGVEAILIFDSAVTDPVVTIEMTNGRESSLHLTGEFTAGDSVKINTKYGSKQLLVNGTRDFSVMDFSYGWLQMPVSLTSTDYATITIPSGTHFSLFRYTESYSSLGDL